MKGFIRKRGSSYAVEIHIGVDPNGKRIRHYETLGNKKAAEKYLRQKLDELETEGAIRAKTVETFGDYMASWLELCAKRDVQPQTFEWMWKAYEDNLKTTPLGRLPLVSVSPMDIQEHYAPMKAYAVLRLHSMIRCALKQAIQWRKITTNAALSVALPKKPKPTHKVIPAMDFPAFVRSAQQERRNGALWVLYLATGCRPSEMLALKWSDFCDNMRRVTIQRTLIRLKKLDPNHPAWWFSERVKTDDGRRTLVLDPQVIFMLKQHRAQQAAEKLAAGEAYTDHGLVFASELGEPMRAQDLCRNVVKRILKRAGLPPMSIYSLRHSAATALLKDKEPLKVVSEMLGHNDIKTTANTYMHVTDDMLEGAAEKLGKRLFG